MSNKRFPSGIMSTCCVPWDESGRFVERIFRLNVQHALHGTKLLYVFGTAGEGYAVTDRQYEEIVTAFADEMRRGHAEPMVGIIDLSLGAIMERIQRGRDLGVHRFEKMYEPDMPLRLLPPYIGSSDEEYHNFVRLLKQRLPEWVPTITAR